MSRRRYIFAVALIVVALIAGTATGLAVHYAAIARHCATSVRLNAGSASPQHAVTLSGQLAAESLALDKCDPVTARQLAVAAWRVSPTGQARSLLATLLIEQQQKGMLPSGHSAVEDVAFSPDGSLLATAYGGSVRLWNPRTRRPVGSALVTLPNKMEGVAFSPDGSQLAGFGRDGMVRLWNRATDWRAGVLIRANSRAGVREVTFSPDGKRLAIVGLDGSARLWNPLTGLPAGGDLFAGSGQVHSAAFSPDGKLLASAGARGGEVGLWDPLTGKQVGTTLPPRAPYRGNGADAVIEVAFSPSGELLASSDLDGSLKPWRIAAFTDPYAALCADVGPPSGPTWSRYAPGEPQPKVCADQ